MPDLGRKYTCYSCHTKFYDLGKPIPTCPKCGADQRDADDAPVVTPSRRGRAAPAPPPEPEPADEPEFGGDEVATPVAAESDDEEEAFVAPDREDEPEEEDEEEEF